MSRKRAPLSILSPGREARRCSRTRRKQSSRGRIRAARTPKVLLDVTGMARDSHPYPKKAISKPYKHDEHRVRLAQIPHENDSCHGYRRPTLKMDEITVSAKVGKGVLTFFQPKTSYAALEWVR